MAMTVPEMTLGVRLYLARKKVRLEQSDMAERIGVSRALVSVWERDAGEPRISYLIAWAKATETSVEWLLDGREISQTVTQPSLFDERDLVPEPAFATAAA